MILLAGSAAFIGFMHSLAPGHWLPVVVLAKARRWSVSHSVLGAVAAASGHILLSVVIGTASILAGSHFLVGYEEKIERYGSLLLVIFGLVYAAVAYFRHSGCGHHSHHHGTEMAEGKLLARVPVFFLFSLGLSPCVATLPVFIASSAAGPSAVLITMVAFSTGVLCALLGATLLIGKGTSRFDEKLLHHPLIEHYGDVLAGLSILLMGIVFFFLPIH